MRRSAPGSCVMNWTNWPMHKSGINFLKWHYTQALSYSSICLLSLFCPHRIWSLYAVQMMEIIFVMKNQSVPKSWLSISFTLSLLLTRCDKQCACISLWLSLCGHNEISMGKVINSYEKTHQKGKHEIETAICCIENAAAIKVMNLL